MSAYVAEIVLIALAHLAWQSRTSACVIGAAPDDATYAAEDDPCFYVVLSEYGDEAAPDANTFDMDVEIVVDEIGEADVADLPLMFQRFTKFWRVTAYVLVNGARTGATLATTNQDVNLTFAVNVNYFSDRDGVNAMLNPDVAAFSTWTPPSREDFKLTWSDVVDPSTNLTNVTGTTKRMGTYFLGQA